MQTWVPEPLCHLDHYSSELFCRLLFALCMHIYHCIICIHLNFRSSMDRRQILNGHAEQYWPLGHAHIVAKSGQQLVLTITLMRQHQPFKGSRFVKQQVYIFTKLTQQVRKGVTYLFIVYFRCWFHLMKHCIIWCVFSRNLPSGTDGSPLQYVCYGRQENTSQTTFY
jgi:hypothetical protein